MTKTRTFIQFIIYVLVPVGYAMRGFYLYESIPNQEFRLYAYDIGKIAWFFFIILVFTPICLNLFRHTPLLGTLLNKLHSYERELTALFTWLIFFHILFIVITIRNFEAAITSITNLQSSWSWGFFGGVTALLVGATANDFMRRFLKRYWERTRNLIYVTFLCGAIHVALIQGSIRSLVLLFSVYLVLRFTYFWQNRTKHH